VVSSLRLSQVTFTLNTISGANAGLPSGNKAYGGAALTLLSSTLAATQLVCTANTANAPAQPQAAASGGAILALFSSLNLAESRFVRNLAQADGGAIALRGESDLTLNGATEFDNNAADGSGQRCFRGRVTCRCVTTLRL
jgi:hypothetical protein